jgi:GNAT superfamily N-acetyltransferase
MLVDLALAQRLERAEGTANARFVEARARLNPELRAEWIEVAGAYAMFDGPESMLTQTFGLGLFEEVTEFHLRTLETFFYDRGAPVMHEISPLVAPSLWPLLNSRGYHPIEFTAVTYLPLQGRAIPESGLPVRIAAAQESAEFARVAADGWATEYPEYRSMIEGFAGVYASCEGYRPFVAEIEGRMIATGGLFIFGGVALLAGASTVPEARKQGAQRALLNARLRFAVEAGCDLAMQCALPGSTSQKNAQRQGFQIAYTRIKWKLGAITEP